MISNDSDPEEPMHDISAGKGQKSEEEKKRHAFYSRRNYYKTKANLEELRSSSYDMRAANIELQAENQRLEGLLACAKAIEAQIQPPSAAKIWPQTFPGAPSVPPNAPPGPAVGQILSHMLVAIQNMAALQREPRGVEGSLPHPPQVPPSLPTQPPQLFKLDKPLDLNILVPLLNDNSGGVDKATMGRLLEAITKNNDQKQESSTRVAEDALPAGSASEELVQIHVTLEELQKYLVCLNTIIQNMKKKKNEESLSS